MTDHDGHDGHDGHYDRGDHDDRVHSLFAQIAADPAPPLGFTADGLAGLGRRATRTRRLAAVGATTAGVAAVGIAIASIPGPGRSSHIAPAASSAPPSASAKNAAHPTPTPFSSAPTDPVCAADVAKAFPSSARDATGVAQRDLALQACPTLRAIDTVLDPTGKHLVEVDDQLDPINPDIMLGETIALGGKLVGTTAHLMYNSHGLASTKEQASGAELPEVAIQVTFSLPGTPDLSPRSTDMSLVKHNADAGSGTVPWNEKSTVTLADASKVTISEVQNGDRVAMKARRILPSGAALTIVAQDGYEGTNGIERPGTLFNPFPFTVEQLTTAVSVEHFVLPEALDTYPAQPAAH